MNAHELRVEEAAAPYLVAPLLTDQLDTFASAPEGFKRLRELVLNLAVRGKLVPQDPKDEPADELLKRMADEKRKLLTADSIRAEKTPKEIDETELSFDIPINWQWVQLSDLAWPQAGFAFKANLFNEVGDGLPLIRIRDVGAKGVATYFSGEYREEFVVENGDWLISMDGQFRVAKWHGPRALLNQRVSRLIFFGNETQQRLICIALQHELLKLQGQKAYTTVDHLSGGQIASRLIPLPPAAEQSRIVAKVDELMALIDTLEAKVGAGGTARGKLLDTLLAALADSPDASATADAWAQLAPHFDLLLQTPADVDRLQQTLLQLAVKGRLVPQNPKDEPAAELLKRIRTQKKLLIAEGKIKRDKSVAEIDEEDELFPLPQGWAWARIATLAEIGTGTTPSRTEASFYAPPEIPWVTSGETSQSLIFDTREKVSKRALKDTSLKLYPPHSLLVALYGQGKTRGQVSELMIAATTNQACAVIVLHGVAFECKSYIKLYFQRIYEQLRELAAGGAQPNLNVGKVADTLIPLPPLPEQSRIVAAVASLTALCDRLRERLAARRELSAKLAAALTEGALS